MKSVVLALCGVLLAPYQCATGEYVPLEDTAPKSLWLMAERFEKEGQSSAREITLQQLVEQYPGSRYARRARAILGIPDPDDADMELLPSEVNAQSDAGNVAPSVSAADGGTTHSPPSETSSGDAGTTTELSRP